MDLQHAKVDFVNTTQNLQFLFFVNPPSAGSSAHSVGPLIRNFLRNRLSDAGPLLRAIRAKMNLIRTLYPARRAALFGRGSGGGLALPRKASFPMMQLYNGAVSDSSPSSSSSHSSPLKWRMWIGRAALLADSGANTVSFFFKKQRRNVM